MNFENGFMLGVVLLMLPLCGYSMEVVSSGEKSDASCTRVDRDLVKSVVTAEGSCELENKLSLATGCFGYRYMGHRQVRYWEGSFRKEIRFHDTYLITVTNVCTGEVEKTFYSGDEHSEQLLFEVRNPNLEPSLTKSYDLAPMTDAEAQMEMDLAKERCIKGGTLE